LEGKTLLVIIKVSVWIDDYLVNLVKMFWIWIREGLRVLLWRRKRKGKGMERGAGRGRRGGREKEENGKRGGGEEEEGGREEGERGWEGEGSGEEINNIIGSKEVVIETFESNKCHSLIKSNPVEILILSAFFIFIQLPCMVNIRRSHPPNPDSDPNPNPNLRVGLNNNIIY
jgi:hypothetical protein